jgi:hypothetical protein
MTVRLTEEKKYFASEASVHRLPKVHNLIINPTFIVIMAAEEFFVDHYNHVRSRESLAACRTETLRLNAEGDFAVVGFRLALDRTLIPV